MGMINLLALKVALLLAWAWTMSAPMSIFVQPSCAPGVVQAKHDTLNAYFHDLIIASAFVGTYWSLKFVHPTPKPFQMSGPCQNLKNLLTLVIPEILHSKLLGSFAAEFDSGRVNVASNIPHVLVGACAPRIHLREVHGGRKVQCDQQPASSS